MESLLQGRVDGIIGVFFHLRAADLPSLRRTADSHCPPGGCPDTPGEIPIDNIFIDNIAASQMASNTLIGQGTGASPC
ncbi:MAG: hypothetical protein IPK19_40190 [Chloroflexi bacterium]|nr:hypothetical protein [Chloroflexota bacterium]